jgi:hypothetical protein
MVYHVTLEYKKDVVIENTEDIWNDPTVKPYIDATNMIAEKYGVSKAGVTSMCVGFWNPKRVLSNLQFDTDTLDKAINFAKETLSTNIGTQRLADRISIEELL